MARRASAGCRLAARAAPRLAGVGGDWQGGCSARADGRKADRRDALLRDERNAVGGALRAGRALALVDRERGRCASDLHWVLDVTMNEDVAHL